MPTATNLAAAREARARGVPVCLNAAPHRALDPAFEALVDLLVVNEVEAGQMAGRSVDDVADASEVAAALADRFVRVVVTLGARGVVHAEGSEEGSEIAHVPAAPVEVVSAHGAGDAFTGALCVSIARGASLAEAVRVAVERAGAHVAGKR